MHFEDSFGSRQSPSLAEAMRQTPQLGQQWVYSSAGSTPNLVVQPGINSKIGSSSQQVIEPMLRCSPTIVEPTYNSQPPQLLSTIDSQSLEEIEIKLCKQLDETLKMNYKKMKNKIKKVKARVNQTDTSIHRIQKLIESVYEHFDDLDITRNSLSNDQIIIQEIPQINYPRSICIDNNNNSNCIQMQNRPTKKITWRRGIQKSNQQPPISNHQPLVNDQEEIT